MRISRSRAAGVGVAALSVFAAPAFAAVDVTSALTAINDTIPAVTAVGSAVFGVHIAIKVWKWVRRAT